MTDSKMSDVKQEPAKVKKEPVKSRKRAAPQSTPAKKTRVKSELKLFQGIWQSNQVFPATALLVAENEMDAQKALLEKIDPQSAESLRVLAVDTSSPHVSVVGLGAPVVSPGAADSAAATGGKMKVFVCDGFTYFPPAPPVAIVVSPDESKVQSLLTETLDQLRVVKAFGEEATLAQNIQEVPIQAGVFAMLSTGEPV